MRKLSQEEELEITLSWLTEELKTKNKTCKTITYCQPINYIVGNYILCWTVFLMENLHHYHVA